MPDLVTPGEKDWRYLDKIKYSREQIEQRALEISLEIKRVFANQIDLQINLLDGSAHWGEIMYELLNPKSALDTNISFYSRNKIKFASDNTLEEINNIEGKRVLITEDLVVTGRTLNYVLELLLAKKPKIIYITTMIDKHELRDEKHRWVDDYIKFVGFESSRDEFLVGYGMSWPSLPVHFRHFENVYLVKAHPKGYTKLIQKN